MLIFDPPCPGNRASAQWTDFTFLLSQCHWNFHHWLNGGSKSPIPKKRERKSHTLPWGPVDHISSQFFESRPKSFFLLVIFLCPYQYSLLLMLCLCLCVCEREEVPDPTYFQLSLEHGVLEFSSSSVRVSRYQ